MFRTGSSKHERFTPAYTQWISAHNAAERHSFNRMINSEVERRIDLVKKCRNIALNERRSTLTGLVDREHRQLTDECKQALTRNQHEHLECLLEEARQAKQHLDQLLKKRAADKMAQQQLMVNPDLRQKAFEDHLREIAYDRQVLQRLEEDDKYRQREEDSKLSQYKTHFEEQLEREEVDAERARIKRFSVDRENCIQADKRKQTVGLVPETEWSRGSFWRWDESDPELRQQRQCVHANQLLAQIDKTKQSRQLEKQVDEQVDDYCFPFKLDESTANTDRKRSVENERHFLNYIEKLRRDEKCCEALLEKHYAECNEDERQKLIAKQKEKHSKRRQFAMEAKHHYEKTMAERDEEAVHKCELKTALGREVQSRVKEAEGLEADEKLKRLAKDIEFRKQLCQQIEDDKNGAIEQHRLSLIRDKESLVRAEADRRRLIVIGNLNRPLEAKMHPWRRLFTSHMT